MDTLHIRFIKDQGTFHLDQEVGRLFLHLTSNILMHGTWILHAWEKSMEMSSHFILAASKSLSLRECALSTTGGGTNKSVGGITKFHYPFMGGSPNFSYPLWGITKSNFKGSENRHLIKCTQKKFAA